VLPTLLRSKNFLDFDTVALSFLFDKHYPIMKQVGLKDSSRDLQVNCAISYYFYLYLMFYVCAARFDVMGNLVKFWVYLNKAVGSGSRPFRPPRWYMHMTTQRNCLAIAISVVDYIWPEKIKE